MFRRTDLTNTYSVRWALKFRPEIVERLQRSSCRVEQAENGLMFRVWDMGGKYPYFWGHLNSLITRCGISGGN